MDGDAAGGGPVTRERILDATEALMRRHGPAKATVVDAARALGVSHASLYRHVASKAALREAVVRRWLDAVLAPLGPVSAGPGPAAARLEAWLAGLAAAKRRKVLDDPEMFAAYHVLAEEAWGAVGEEHLGHMRAQVARILADGVAEGAFRVRDADAAARAVLDATTRFHHPEHVRADGARDPAAAEAALRRVVALLLAGLAAGAV